MITITEKESQKGTEKNIRKICDQTFYKLDETYKSTNLRISAHPKQINIKKAKLLTIKIILLKPQMKEITLKTARIKKKIQSLKSRCKNDRSFIINNVIKK